MEFRIQNIELLLKINNNKSRALVSSLVSPRDCSTPNMLSFFSPQRNQQMQTRDSQPISTLPSNVSEFSTSNDPLTIASTTMPEICQNLYHSYQSYNY